MEETTHSAGRLLRNAREKQSMSVVEVARATRIPLQAIRSIEAEHYDDLPGEVFTRGFLRAYAKSVGLEPNEVLALHTASRRSHNVDPLPVATPVARSRAPQFGIVAIAFMFLLVLFTLALTLVLKPRGNGRPRELSRSSVPASSNAAPSNDVPNVRPWLAGRV